MPSLFSKIKKWYGMGFPSSSSSSSSSSFLDNNNNKLRVILKFYKKFRGIKVISTLFCLI
jgi:hypothetical protein